MRGSLTTYDVISLGSLISKLSPEQVLKILSTFSCKKDEDVETYLKKKATTHEKRHISRTYLVFTTEQSVRLEAYFTIAVSSLRIEDLECSRNLQNKLNVKDNIAQSYLIGQIGRRDGSQKKLGEFAITHAIGMIKEVNSKIGCRVIRLDCKDPLITYYEEKGFTQVGRNEDADLNQMIHIIA